MAARTKPAKVDGATTSMTLNAEQVEARRKAMFGRAPGRAQMAMTVPTRGPTIASSALRKIGDDSGALKRQRRNRAQTDRTWQIKSFDYAEQVGEYGALLTLQSNVVALCAFPVRRRDQDTQQWEPNDPESDITDEPVEDLPQLEDPKPKPNPVTGEMMPAPVPPPKLVMPKQTPLKKKSEYDPRPTNVMAAFVGPDGEQDELVRRAAWNLFAAGEVTLLGTPSKEANGILWEFLSIEELYPNASGDYVRQRGGAGSAIEQLPADNYTGRCWRSSERYSDLATCQAKRALPLLQEVATLTRRIDSIAKSGLSADMLFVPEEMSFSSARDGDSPEDADDPDDFDEELFTHMTTPIADDASAAAVVPLVVRGKAEHGQHIRMIDLTRKFDEFAQSLRAEALTRLAKALDSPPEAVAGKGSVNHWTAANIDSEFIVKHIQPIGRALAKFLTMGYLRPMLEAYEGMSPEESAGFMIEFDPSPVIARADEAKSAMDLKEWLSDEAVLAANGFTKADAASGDAIRQRRIWELVSSQPATFAKLLPLVNGFETIDPAMLAPAPPPPALAPPDVPTPAASGGAASDAPGAAKADEKVPATGNEQPAAGAPRPADEPKATGPAAMALLVERLTTAADAAMVRGVDRCASRVISLAQSKAPDLHSRIRNVRKANVMSMCTETDLRSLKVDRTSLLRGAFDELAVDSRRWIADHLETDGMDHRRADATAAECAQELTARLAEIVHDNLLSPFTSGTNGLRVPIGLVPDVLDRVALAGAV